MPCAPETATTSFLGSPRVLDLIKRGPWGVARRRFARHCRCACAAVLAACSGGDSTTAPAGPTTPPSLVGPLASLSVTPSASSLVAGETFRLSVIGKDSAGRTVGIDEKLIRCSVTQGGPESTLAYTFPNGPGQINVPGNYTLTVSYGRVSTSIPLPVVPGTVDNVKSTLDATWSTTTLGAIVFVATIRNQYGVVIPGITAAEIAFAGGTGGMTSVTCATGVCKSQYTPAAARGKETVLVTVRGNALQSKALLTFRDPVQFTTVTVGASHSCGLSTSGEAFCWGDNSFGQLGDSSTVSSASPVPVANGLRFRAIAAGDNHTCGATSDGHAYCWGAGTAGQLGGYVYADRSAPMPVAEISDFSRLVAGTDQTCGQTASGLAYCWGSHLAQAPAARGNVLTALVAHGNWTCGTRADSATVCWAGNGLLTAGTPVAAPAFASISIGGTGGCGLTSTGLFHCWNFADKLVAGQFPTSQVFPSLAFSRIVAGIDSYCGVTADNRIGCWGTDHGQFGDFVRITGDVFPAGAAPSQVLGSTIAASTSHMCGLTATGDGMCWGVGSAGQIGDRFFSTRNVPTKVNASVSVQIR